MVGRRYRPEHLYRTLKCYLCRPSDPGRNQQADAIFLMDEGSTMRATPEA